MNIGHLEVLRWATANVCNWDEYTCSKWSPRSFDGPEPMDAVGKKVPGILLTNWIEDLLRVKNIREMFEFHSIVCILILLSHHDNDKGGSVSFRNERSIIRCQSSDTTEWSTTT